MIEKAFVLIIYVAMLLHAVHWFLEHFHARCYVRRSVCNVIDSNFLVCVNLCESSSSSCFGLQRHECNYTMFHGLICVEY